MGSRSSQRSGRTVLRALAMAGVTGFFVSAGPASAAEVEGLWYDDSGKGAVRIIRCGQALCGRIAWLAEPNDKRGRPLTDGNNPKSARRNRPICGLQVIGRLAQQGGGGWDNGWIYDPKTGKSYDVAIELQSRNRLAVTGYLGLKFLSRTLIWRRAPDTLPSCDNAQS